MNKPLAALAATVLAVGAAVGVASTASATSHHHSVCVPSDAYTETIIDTPEQTVEHPAIPAVTDTVEHEAVYTTVHHDAVTHVEHTDAVTHTEWEYIHFLTWHTKWQDSPTWNAQGNPHSIGWYLTGNTRTITDVEASDVTVEDSAAYDEQVLVTAAWTETIIVTPEVPAWTETIPAVTHEVTHEAVTCPPCPTVTPTPTETSPEPTPTQQTPTSTPTPTVTPEPSSTPSVQPTVPVPSSQPSSQPSPVLVSEVGLAATGSNAWLGAWVAGAILVAGVVIVLLARRSKS